MGKGDRKSRRGKIYRGSYGNARAHGVKPAVAGAKSTVTKPAAAKKAAPKFSGNVALVRVHSRCQVHPVIAQIWRTRLPKYIVIVANDRYLPDRVNFSMRTSADTNLLDFLGAIDLGEGEGSYARGHDQATGGSLPVARWNLLLSKLGFDETVHAVPTKDANDSNASPTGGL